MSAHVIALVNQKGGVGKTTTAVSLAAALTKRGERVLLADLDPQSNATSAAGLVENDLPGVYEALLDDLPVSGSTIRVDEGFDVLPANRTLAGADVELVPQLAREQKLAVALRPILARYDWILLDCPPSLGLLTVNALAAASSVLIPVQCEYLALEGLSRLVQTLDLVRKNLNPGLSIAGVLLTMFDARTRLASEVEEEVREHFDETFATVIPRSVRLGEAPSHGKTIFKYDPSGRGATAYEALADELINRQEVKP
ncbi:MAG TPA: ParA family protein [Dehalococcoidia bacterium]|nr:ParA family protein [Dehalococcoidia bacterium]